MAGVFFAFSSFVMPALARLPPAQGIVAMQSINVAAVSPVFMAALFGTAAACLVLAVSALRSLSRPGSSYLLAGSLFYLFGVIVVTAVCNVPRNDALATLDPASAEAAGRWAAYVASWTTWNHLRAFASLDAAAVFTLALLLAGRAPASTP